ncbi:MAG: hypothetical protein QW611_06745 [Ignisphaera sp.]
MRSVSNILAIIMMIGIAVMCTLVTGIISSNILHQQAPKGVSITIPRAVWHRVIVSQGYVYIFDLMIHNSGTEKIDISNVSVIIGGNRYIITQNVGTVKPNNWIHVTGSVNTNTVLTNTDILVEVSFCSESGFCNSVSVPARQG